MIRVFEKVYYWLIAIPLFFVLTGLTASVVIVATFVGHGERAIDFAGKWWGKIGCWICLHRIEVKGLENIQPGVSYVITPNHQSSLDILLVYGFLGVPFSWVMKKELRKIPLVGKACEVGGHILVDRTNIHSIRETMRKAEEVLKNGRSIVIFPEGSRTLTGKMSRFKKGAFQIAIDMQLPIIPAVIDGAYQAMPRGTYFVKPQKLTLTLLPSISTQGLKSSDLNPLKDHVQQIIEDELYQRT